jgi:thiosulfate/3-mercaptopyruvate sulfurtransferase
MNWRINLLLFLLVWSCQNEKLKPISEVKTTYLIEASELKLISNQPNIKILDFRNEKAYNKEHIKGALHISRADIEDNSYPYSGMMASQLQIENLFSKFGINTTDTVIVYDDKGLCEAARLWWILQNYNFNNIKLLHGGIKDWISINGITTSKKPKTTATDFKFLETSKMNYYITKEDVKNALNHNVTILDTRSIDEYTGKTHKDGAIKAGRIPNSMNIDWAENMNYTGDKRLKSVKDLENLYKKLNIKKTDSIILYCHSGVRSAHTTFVLTQLLGYENVKNYDGSWTEWSYFNELPFESDLLNTN